MLATKSEATSYVRPALFVAVALLGLLAFFWFRPGGADQDRLTLLQADPTLQLPTLAGQTPELIERDSEVASRSWRGEWSITESTDRYALGSRRVNRYAEDLFDHMDASPWTVTSARCQEDLVVITGRQIVDGDWATLEFTAWATDATGQLSVRSAISAVAGAAFAGADPGVAPVIDCPEI